MWSFAYLYAQNNIGIEGAETVGNSRFSNKKGHRGGMNAVALVELMVIETTTSSMRTKRSTN